MDYKLDNENLGLLEKNKKLFSEFSKDKADPNFEGEQIEKDTFKMYEDFMKEKDSIVEVVNELVNYACGLCKTGTHQSIGKFNKLEDMINYKNRIIMILENYQEQPGLLDPILGLIVPKLMNNSIILIEYILKTNSTQTTPVYISIQCLYQIVYILCKIRGYQTITKFFSSEVHIFEPVINFLLKCNPEDNENWYLIYVLILWTSILGLVPFDIDTIDTNGIIISNLTEYYKKTLTLSGNLRDISAYSLSKFITRPDIIKKGILDSFISYCVQTLQNENLNVNQFLNLGLLSALCEIFKNGLPKDLFKYVDYLSNTVVKYQFPNHIKNSGVFKRLMCKLSQRIGLILLKPKFQKWRYKLSLKTLKEDMYDHDNTQYNDDNDNNEEEELDYEIDFGTLETLIDQLLTSLNDKEYIVRWSAAKGVGRLCERLTKEMVDDIFQSLKNLFEDEENEYSWQGACLCIAELCKRGMILPDKIAELIPFLEKALIFEVNKGTFCSGSIVRDSACYVVWALARAYSRDVMKPFVERLAKSLILTILFDKEVNCRRAASAAFQEHVGRQGFFPHGIEIITEADYFTLGKKIYCYLNISTFIAQYDEYFESMVNYLSFNRLLHVEQSIRQVSAEALGLLVPFNPELFVNKIIKKLLEYCYSKTLFVRHGAIVGIGYILVGLRGKWDFEGKARRIQKKIMDGLNQSEKKILEDSNYRTSFEEKYEKIKYINNMNFLDSTLTEDILKIPNTLDKLNLYRGKGAEIMRTAVDNLIRLISESSVPIDESSFIYYVDVLLDNIKHPNQDLQKEACESLKLLNYNNDNLINTSEYLNKEIQKRFKNVINLAVNDDNIYANKGFTMSIPYFDSKLILNNYPEILKSLFTNAKLKSKNNDAEVRKLALESLSHVVCRFIKEYPDLIIHEIKKIINYMLEGLEDYEIDKKLGDVGSKVREAAMRSLTSIMINLFKSKYFNEKFCTEFYKIFSEFILLYLNGLLKQSVEKMGRMRLTAGDCLQLFFNEIKEENLLDLIPHYEVLRSTFLEDTKYNEYNQINNTSWLEPSYAYKKVIHLLLYPEYSLRLFEGLITSIGGITEDTQRCSLEEYDNLIQKIEEENRSNFIQMVYGHIKTIFTKYEKDDKVIEPLYNTLGHLLTKSAFIDVRFLQDIDQIYKFVMKENFDSKNIHKILSSVDIYYNILFFEREDSFNLFNRTLKSILVLMTHKYPVVRKKASEKLYLFILGIDDPETLGISYEDVDSISCILSEINWSDPVASIKEGRNKIAEMLKINMEIPSKSKI